MANYTTNLNLLKKDPETDGNDYFNIETMLNDNWDKIDAGVAAKETPAGAQAKMDNLAGTGRTTETVKSNADAITALNQTVTSHLAEDATTAVKGHVQLGTGAAQAAAGNHNHSGVYAPATHNHSADNITSGTLPLTKGGTGATTAAAALTALGLTATAAELNYVDGVTSAIQTQLNGKAASSHNHSGTYEPVDANIMRKNVAQTMSAAINMADQQLIRADIKDYAEVVGTTPATSGTCTFDLTTGNVFNLIPTGAVTVGFTNWPASGRAGSATIRLANGATVYAKTFAAAFKWVNDEIPDMSEANKAYDIVISTTNGGTTIHAACVGPYSA
ncbi:MAG: hypothetical protein VB106_17380 [Clostridiaceae bacterium]|nr:hypothetical protein [Clostridiaceae bacterium]